MWLFKVNKTKFKNPKWLQKFLVTVGNWLTMAIIGWWLDFTLDGRSKKWLFNGQTTLVINFGPWAVTTQIVLWVVGDDGESMFDGTFDLKSPPG